MELLHEISYQILNKYEAKLLSLTDLKIAIDYMYEHHTQYNIEVIADLEGEFQRRINLLIKNKG